MLAKLDTAFPHNNDNDGAFDFQRPHCWRALVVRSSKEQDAADWLRKSRVPAYWPNYVRQIKAAGQANGFQRRRSHLCPVIPGYLFMPEAEVSNGRDPWPIVDQTPGIIGFLRNTHGYAAALDDSDIEIIRRIEGGLNIPPPDVSHSFKMADKVRFTDDIYRSWPSGKIKKLEKDGRIGVEVPLLGRIVLVAVFPHQIEAM